MNGTLSNEILPRRFAPYIKELQELFAIRGIPCGSAGDIVTLAHSVSSKGSLRDDITSIVRSIIYREREAIPRATLLQLLLLAGTGSPDVEGSSDVRVAINQLHDYVGEVITSLRKRSFVEEEEEKEGSAEFEIEHAQTLENSAAEASPAIEFIPESGTEGGQQPSTEPVRLIEPIASVELSIDPTPSVDEGPLRQTVPSSELSIDPVVSAELPIDRVFSVDEDPHRFEVPSTELPIDPVPVATVTQIEAPPPPFQPQRSTEIIPVTPVAIAPYFASKPRRSQWVAGISVLLVALIAGFLWRSRSKAQSSILLNASQPVVASFTPPPQPAPQANDLIPSPVPSIQKPSAAKFYPDSRTPSRLSETSKANPLQGNLTPLSSQPLIAGSPHTSASQLPLTNTKPSQRLARSLPSASAKSAPLTPSKPGSFLVSSGVMSGNLITIPTTPNYPKMANMAGIQGQVILQAVVSSKGTVVATHVLDGHHMLRAAAAHAVRSWQYRPYMVNGKPTDVATIVIVDFHLHQ